MYFRLNVHRRIIFSGSAAMNSIRFASTMKRMNLRDVPDDVYAELAEAAAENRQSLNAYVVDQLTELARVVRVREYVTSYTPPTGSRVTLEDAVAAVREVREAS